VTAASHCLSSRLSSRRSGAFLVALFGLGLGLGCSRGEADATSPAATPAAATPAAAATTPAPAVPPQAAAAAAQPGAPTAPAADVPLAPEQIPAVVARIDGRDVTREDLLARAAEARGALAERGYPSPASTRAFYRKVLDDVIGNRLLFQDLVAQGQAAAAADVDKRLAEIRGQFASAEEFKQALAQRSFDEVRLRRDLEEGLTVQKWVQEKVIPAIAVSEAEVQKFYEDHGDQMQEPESVGASHLLVAVARDATAEQKAAGRKRAEELRARLVAGEDFAAVAREASQDPGSAPRGGDLGRVYRGQTVPEFESAAFALAPGALSDVVETPYGFHVIRVADKKPAGKLALVQVKERIEQSLKQRALEARVRETVQALGNKAKVEILI
jgi:peptidyl-prolyl cis-trans isomerase C